MAFEHRREERKKKLEESRSITTRSCELVAAAQDGLARIALWGGPQAGDFSDDPEIDAARLTETLIGIAAAQQLFGTLNQEVTGYPGVTVIQALQRISSP